MSEDPVRAHVDVPLAPPAAFEAWVALDAWWPAEFTWSQGALRGLTIEPRDGGLCSEHGPGGFRCDWGRVRVWAPPERLVLGWHIGPTRAPEPDPDRASEVELRFAAEGAEAYRDGMGDGWRMLLAAYAAAAASAA